MVIKKVPHNRLHWSKFVDNFCTPTIANYMIRRRFEVILKRIHLIDNNLVVIDKNDPSHNKIAMTRRLIEACNELCGQLWNSKKKLCVHEMMVKCNGKHSPI